jgi:Type II secretion system (T2SS), protein E, N-terminal domain
MAVEEYSVASGRELERRVSLLSLLVEAGVASEEQLQLALAEGLATGERLGEVVVRQGWIDQVGLARVLARQWGLPFLEDAQAQPKGQLPPGFAAARAFELRACPITGGETGVLVAVAEPREERFTAVREQLGGEVAFVVVAEATLERLLQQLEAGEEGERAETPVMVAGAGAAAAEEQARPLQQLLGELELASERLAELRARAEQLLRQQEQTQAELDASHRELEHLQQQRREDQATIAHLEQQLAEERRRLDVVKAKVDELSETLTGA